MPGNTRRALGNSGRKLSEAYVCGGPRPQRPDAAKGCVQRQRQASPIRGGGCSDPQSDGVRSWWWRNGLGRRGVLEEQQQEDIEDGNQESVIQAWEYRERTELAGGGGHSVKDMLWLSGGLR